MRDQQPIENTLSTWRDDVQLVWQVFWFKQHNTEAGFTALWVNYDDVQYQNGSPYQNRTISSVYLSDKVSKMADTCDPSAQRQTWPRWQASGMSCFVYKCVFNVGSILTFSMDIRKFRLELAVLYWSWIQGRVIYDTNNLQLIIFGEFTPLIPEIYTCVKMSHCAKSVQCIDTHGY